MEKGLLEQKTPLSAEMRKTNYHTPFKGIITMDMIVC